LIAAATVPLNNILALTLDAFDNSQFASGSGATPATVAPQSPFANYGAANWVAQGLDLLTFGGSTAVLRSQWFGSVLNITDQFGAGFADAVSAGLSTRMRANVYGTTATQNHQGSVFQAGQLTGTVVGMGIAIRTKAIPAFASLVVGVTLVVEQERLSGTRGGCDWGKSNHFFASTWRKDRGHVPFGSSRKG
jgi:hypothetical protein